MLSAEGSPGPLTSGSVPAQAAATGLGQIKVSDLVSADTYITDTGTVFGSLHKVAEWSEFSTAQKYKNGHFFPVTLSEEYAGQEIEVDGPEIKGKKAKDLNWYLYIADKSSKFTFKCKGETLFTLDFTYTTLE